MNLVNNLNSIHNSLEQLNTSARKIAEVNLSSGTNIQQEFANEIVNQRAIEANSIAINTKDKVMGSVIDIKA